MGMQLLCHCRTLDALTNTASGNFDLGPLTTSAIADELTKIEVRNISRNGQHGGAMAVLNALSIQDRVGIPAFTRTVPVNNKIKNNKITMK